MWPVFSFQCVMDVSVENTAFRQVSSVAFVFEFDN